jgi:hypothetical protein
MAEAQRKRWAAKKQSGAMHEAAKPTPPRAKRKIGEEGMKRIIAATKKHWAWIGNTALDLSPAPVKHRGEPLPRGRDFGDGITPDCAIKPEVTRDRPEQGATGLTHARRALGSSECSEGVQAIGFIER